MALFDNNLNIPTQIENFMKFGIPNNFSSGTPVLNNQPTTPVPTKADVYGGVVDAGHLPSIEKGMKISNLANEWSKAVYNDALAKGEWTLDHTLGIQQFSLLSKQAEEIKQRAAADAQYAVSYFAPDSSASGPNA